MKAVLLAAGFGTRLRPLTDTIPKCLVPILGKPLLAIWLDRLFASGRIERVLINTHYLSERVVEHVESSRWKDRIDLVYEPQLLGTGGTLWQNREWLGQEPVLVAHADNLTFFDVAAFADAHGHRPAGCDITMMTFDTDAPQTCGIVETEGGVVVRFHEKVANPPGTRANAAVYIVEKSVVDGMADLDPAFIDLSTQVLPRYMGRIFTWHNGVYHRDIGNLASLRLAERELSGLRIELG